MIGNVGDLCAILTTCFAVWWFFVQKKAHRRWLVGVLMRAGSGARLYRRMLVRRLKWAKRFYGDSPFGWEGLYRCISVAFVYPLLALGVVYLFGSQVEIGGQPILPTANGAGAGYGFLTRLGILISVFATCTFFATILARSEQIDAGIERVRTRRFPGVPTMVFNGGIGIALAIPTFLIIGNTMLAAIISVLCIFGNLALAVAVAAAAAAAGAGAGAGTVAVAGAAAVAGAVAGSGAAAGAAAVAGAAALAGAGAVLLTYIAPIIGADVNPTVIATFVTVILLLPFINALFDHLSVGASRLLLGLAATERPLRIGSIRLSLGLSTTIEIIGDLLFAILCLTALAFFLPLTAELANVWLIPAEGRLDWGQFVQSTFEDPFGAGLAGTLMLFSTLLPTLLHTLLALTCLFSRPLARLLRAGRVLETLDGKDSVIKRPALIGIDQPKVAGTEDKGDLPVLGAFFCCALAFGGAVFMTVVLFMFGDAMLNWLFAFKEGFGKFLYLTAFVGGVLGGEATGPLYLFALIAVVIGLTALLDRFGRRKPVSDDDAACTPTEGN